MARNPSDRVSRAAAPANPRRLVLVAAVLGGLVIMGAGILFALAYRDTPETLKAYVTSFDAPILALTGTPEQVAQAAKAYRVYYAKHPEAGGDYSMDHSSVIYVMDPQGRFTASFTHQSAPEEIAERLKKLLA